MNPAAVYAQCADGYGSVAFTGYRMTSGASGQPDQFSFILLDYLPANTPILFTDKGLIAANRFQDDADAKTDGTLSWSHTEDLPAGTSVLILLGASPLASAGDLETVGTGQIKLGLGGDQLFAYTGTGGQVDIQAALLMNKTAWETEMMEAGKPVLSSSMSLDPQLNADRKQTVKVINWYAASPAEDMENAFQAVLKPGLVLQGDRAALRKQIFEQGFDIYTSLETDQVNLPANVAWNADSPTFKPIVVGIGKLSIESDACYYQWERSTDNVTYTPITSSNDFSGEKSAEITVETPLTEATWFRVRMMGAATVYSEPVQISPPSITGQPASTTVRPGSPVGFQILVREDVGITYEYQWEVDKGAGFVPILVDPTYSGAQTKKLSIANANLNLSGYTYRCVVHTAFFRVVSNAAKLTVNESEPPGITMAASSVSYIEGNPSVYLDEAGQAVVNDSDSPDFEGGRLVVKVLSNAVKNEDNLSLNSGRAASGSLLVDGSTISYAGTAIGTVMGGMFGQDLVLTFMAGADAVAVQSVIRSLQYGNSNGIDPSTSERTVSIELSDGDGGTSEAVEVKVAVVGVNDAPTLTATALNLTYTEGEGLVEVFKGFNLNTVEAGQKISRIVLELSNVASDRTDWIYFGSTEILMNDGARVAAGRGQWRIDVSLIGTSALVSLTSNSGLEPNEALKFLEPLRYMSTSKAPGTAAKVMRVVSLQDNGGTANGGVDTSNPALSSTISIIAVNDPPVLEPIGNQTVNEGSLLSFTAIANDPDSPTLTYSLEDAPTGASINATTGVFNWTPTEAQGPYIYTFTVLVSDGTLTDSEKITVNVNEVNDAPVLEPIGNQTVNEGTLLSFTAMATDSDSPTLVFSLEDAPTGASINAMTGEFNWTPTEAEGPNIYTFTVLVSDGTLADSEEITVNVNEVNDAPVLEPIGDQLVQAGETLRFTAIATDVDLPANTLTHSLIDGPSGASINAITGAFSWTPTETQALKSYEFTVLVSDGLLSAEEKIAVLVTKTPEVTSVSSLTTNGIYGLGSSITLQVVFDQPVEVIGAPSLELAVGGTMGIANYSSGSGSNILLLNYTVEAGHNADDLDYTSQTALQLNGGSIRNEFNQGASLVLPIPGETGSLGTNANLQIDGIVPTVLTLGLPADGYYVAGQSLDFRVDYSEDIVVNTTSGTARLPIDIGGQTVYADYVSGSGTTSLNFSYTVTTGMEDRDGIELGLLELNGSTITDKANNTASLLWNGVGSTRGVKVDSKAPQLSLMINNGAIYTNDRQVLLTLETTDSDLESMDFSNDNTIWSSAEPFATTKVWMLEEEDGAKEVFVRVKDQAGNWSLLYAGIRLDQTAPTVVGVEEGKSYNSDREVRFNEGVASLNGTPFHSGTMVSEDGTYELVVTDRAANVTRITFTIDKTAPVMPLDFVAVSSDAKVKVHWSANGETDLQGYMLYVQTAGGIKEKLAELAKGTELFLHKGLTNGIEYRYFLVAYDLLGNMSEEAIATATPIGTQSITFLALADQTYGASDLLLGATSSSGLEIAYRTSDPAIAEVYQDDTDGGAWKLHIKAAGMVDVTASQSGSAAFLSAVDLTQQLKINKASLPTITFEEATFTYDGTAKSLAIAEELPTGVAVSYVGNAQIEAGEYTVEATVDGGNNYTSQTLTAKLTIAKAALPVMEFADATFTYDGTAKSLAIAEELPTGVAVSYVGNAQIEAGDYTVEAAVDGGNNYASQTLKAKLTIAKAALPVMEFADATFTYDGTAKSLAIAEELPTGVAVSYVGNAQIEAGEYKVEATVDGGNNYVSQTLIAKLTIAKAALPVMEFADATFTYDGTAKSLAIAEELPTGVAVSYVGNAQIEAGEYKVEATVDGGNNYVSQTLIAKLTIEKAMLPLITFADARFTYDGAAKSLAIAEQLPAGATVSYAGNGQVEAGKYTVEARIDGGKNYRSLTLYAQLEIEEAPMANISFDDASFVYDGTVRSLKISGSLPTGATVSYTNNDQTKVGVYTVEAHIVNKNNGDSYSLTAKLTITKMAQEIIFLPIASVERDAGVIRLSISSNSKLPIRLYSDNLLVAEVQGVDELLVRGVGRSVIRAEQDGDDNHRAAVAVEQTLEVLNDAGSKLPVRVHPAVSPNGDGINEFLRIEGIEQYLENKLTVFEANGNVVQIFENYDNYNNRFDGVRAGRPVPNGTYFYVLEVKINGKWAYDKGYFVVRKDN